MSNYAAHMEVIRRERRTEEAIRALDASDIVTWIHWLEDHNETLEAAIEGLRSEMRRYLPILAALEEHPETWAAFAEGTGIATLNGYRAALKQTKEQDE